MTRTNALLLLGLLVVIVSLALGEDGQLSQTANRHRDHALAATARQAPQAEQRASNATPPPLRPERLVSAPEPVRPELLAPRME
jgi:hypothetical protein